MIHVGIVLWLIFSHFVADFLMQDVNWANDKSKSFTALIKHTATYSICMGVLVWIASALIDPTGGWGPVIFTLHCFVWHTVTDYFTSRWVRKDFESKNYGTAIPNTGAFTKIGVDQCLHYVQLFLSWLYIYLVHKNTAICLLIISLIIIFVVPPYYWMLAPMVLKN